MVLIVLYKDLQNFYIAIHFINQTRRLSSFVINLMFL